MSQKSLAISIILIVNRVEFYDAEGVMLKEYLDHAVELRPLQSIWLIVDGQKEQGGTGTNFLVDWASQVPVKAPIVESMMAGSSYQLGFSYKSESVVVKEWRYGIEKNVDDL